MYSYNIDKVIVFSLFLRAFLTVVIYGYYDRKSMILLECIWTRAILLLNITIKTDTQYFSLLYLLVLGIMLWAEVLSVL